MNLFFLMVSGVLLGTITWQDFRDRAISAWLLAFLAVSEGLRGYLLWGTSTILRQSLQNSVIISSMLLVVWIYALARKRKWMNLFKEELGVADLILLLILGISFSPFIFIVFILIGFVFALTSTIIIRMVVTSTSHTVPLAGYLGIWAIVVFILLVIFPEFPGNNDSWLFYLLTGIA